MTAQIEFLVISAAILIALLVSEHRRYTSGGFGGIKLRFKFQRWNWKPKPRWVCGGYKIREFGFITTW